MRTIHINQREARLLRDNLTGNREGYDYTDLLRLDSLAKKLTTLQAEYGVRMAELAREERQARRAILRNDNTEQAQRILTAIELEVTDLHEEAETQYTDLVLEDGDYKLIAAKLDSVERWTGSDDIRHVIIGMMEAVKAAANQGEPSTEKVRSLRG